MNTYFKNTADRTTTIKVDVPDSSAGLFMAQVSELVGAFFQGDFLKKGGLIYSVEETVSLVGGDLEDVVCSASLKDGTIHRIATVSISLPSSTVTLEDESYLEASVNREPCYYEEYSNVVFDGKAPKMSLVDILSHCGFYSRQAITARNDFANSKMSLFKKELLREFAPALAFEDDYRRTKLARLPFPDICDPGALAKALDNVKKPFGFSEVAFRVVDGHGEVLGIGNSRVLRPDPSGSVVVDRPVAVLFCTGTLGFGDGSYNKRGERVESIDAFFLAIDDFVRNADFFVNQDTAEVAFEGECCPFVYQTLKDAIGDRVDVGTIAANTTVSVVVGPDNEDITVDFDFAKTDFDGSLIKKVRLSEEESSVIKATAAALKKEAQKTEDGMEEEHEV